MLLTCTVALGVKQNDMNTFSFHVKFVHSVTKNKKMILAISPTPMVANALPSSGHVNLINYFFN